MDKGLSEHRKQPIQSPKEARMGRNEQGKGGECE